jgi:hypothetical protein
MSSFSRNRIEKETLLCDHGPRILNLTFRLWGGLAVVAFNLQRPNMEREATGFEVEPARLRPKGAATNQPRASPWDYEVQHYIKP